MRTLLIWMTVLLAAPAFTAPAEASTRKELRQESREIKKMHRQLEKASKRWDKAVRKGKDRKVARQDAKLQQIYRSELARLRGMGLQSRIPVVKSHPAHPRPPYAPSTQAEALRDNLVQLRNLQRARMNGKGKRIQRERALLNQLQDHTSRRVERKQRQLARAKRG